MKVLPAPDGVVLHVVVVRLDLGGLGRQVPRRRLRLDVGQRLLLFEDVVGRRAGATRVVWVLVRMVRVLVRVVQVLVRDDSGGSEIARIADRRQIIFGVDQACCGRTSRGRLRSFAWPLPRCVIRLTAHG
jgi:hypothetical protein